MQLTKSCKCCLGCAFLLVAGNHEQPFAQASRLPPSGEPRTPRIAVVNAVRFHIEVYCALLWSFVGAGATAEAFVDLQATARIEDVIRHWYSKPFQAHQGFLGQACEFDLIVVATFPENHLEMVQQVVQSGCSHQRFLLVVHNPYELANPATAAVVKTLRGDVLALAPHTVRASAHALHSRGLPMQAHLFIPVFPVEVASSGNGSAHGNTFVLQGLFEPRRRDYSSLFRALLAEESLMQDDSFRLHLIGRGNLAIPLELQERVVKEPNLAYPEYYRVVQRALAVLPAFASSAYYTVKASSSVAAALICGIPLLANDQLLAAYSYMPRNATFPQAEGENEAAVMAKVMRMPLPQILEAKKSVQAAREEAYRQNSVVVGRILQGLPALHLGDMSSKASTDE